MKVRHNHQTTLPNDPSYDISAIIWNTDDHNLTEKIKNDDIDPTAAITESRLNLNYSTHSNANDPTSDQKSALSGTEGTPSNINRYVTSNDTRFNDLSELIIRNVVRNSAGWVSGGEISTTVDNLLINIAGGIGVAFNGQEFQEVAWNSFYNVAHIVDTYNFIAIKYDGTLSVTSSEIISNQYVRLGKFWWDPVAGFITVIWNTPLVVGNYQEVVDNFIGNVVGATVDGLTVSEKASPNYCQLIFSAGTLHVRLSDFNLGQTSRFVKILQCIDFYVARDVVNDNNTVDTTLWADKTKTAATALTVMTTDYWAKALIVVNTQGLYYYVYPEAEYATEDEAKAAALPLVAALLADDNACICMIVFKKGDASIANRIYDIRPNFQRVFGTELFSAGGATISHNALLNLDYASAGHTGFQPALGFTAEDVSNKRTSFQVTPDDTHYPSEKLVKDSLNAKQNTLAFTPVPDSRTVNGYALTADVTVTKSDVSLGNVTNDAQLKRSAADFTDGITEKTTYTAADKILIEDSAAANVKKYMQMSNILKKATPINITPANPVAITSSSPTFKMFGLGSTFAITPLVTGNVIVSLNFFPSGAGTSGKNSFKLVYGTGTAPSNGANSTGTQIGLTKSGGAVSSITATDAEICWVATVSGLTVGTAYWFDVQGAKFATNTNVSMSSIEACLAEV